MISVFNALPVSGTITGASFNAVQPEFAATAAAETVGEIIWLLQAGGY